MQTQISQVNDQITTLQNEIGRVSQETLQTQQQTIESRIAELQIEIHTLEGEINAILLTIKPQGSIPTVIDPTLLTLEPTPTLTTTQKGYHTQQLELLDSKQTDLDQKKSMLNLYQQAYTNLLVYGETSLNGNQGYRQDQLQGTLSLYQQIYNSLLNNYEQIRLTRLRSTPNVLKIESASVPKLPIQPQPARSAVTGGAVGLFIMAAIAFVIEYLDDTFKTPEDITRILVLSVIGMIGEMEKN